MLVNQKYHSSPLVSYPDPPTHSPRERVWGIVHIQRVAHLGISWHQSDCRMRHMTVQERTECNKTRVTFDRAHEVTRGDLMAVAQIKDALQSAVTWLGFDEAKDKQKEAVVIFASGRDVFVSLPTGYGKSLCYSCLPCLFGLQTGEVRRVGAVVVVVTPLVAIIKEQSEMLTIHITSDSTEEALLEGRFRIVFISPEQLLGLKKWRDMLRSEVYQKSLTAFGAQCVKKR